MLKKIIFITALIIFFGFFSMGHGMSLWERKREVFCPKYQESFVGINTGKCNYTAIYVSGRDLTNKTEDFKLRWYMIVNLVETIKKRTETNWAAFKGEDVPPKETRTMVPFTPLSEKSIVVFAESVNGKKKVPDRLDINLSDHEGVIEKYCVWDKYAITYKVKGKIASGGYKRKKKTASGWYCFFEVDVDKKNNKLILTDRYDFKNKDKPGTDAYNKMVFSKRVAV